MTGKDWFTVGVRLLGVGVLYYGIQEALINSLSTMFFANLERQYAYYAQFPSGWWHLFHGGVNIAIGLLALVKAGQFADWCFARDRQPARYGTVRQMPPLRPRESSALNLTEEQEDLLIRMGDLDDGSPIDLPANGKRIMQDLVERGLVYGTGDRDYDLTDEGRRLYEELTGEDSEA